MLSRKQKHILLRLLSLFSIVRGYNILVIVIAQYLTSVYILAPDRSLRDVILDPNLFVIVLASALVIAAGYIINNFYDSEKDLINRPRKTMLDRLVSQQTKLIGYFIMNLLAVILASYVSFRAVLFFTAYIFAIWLYSHKLKRLPFLGNISSALLAIAPFFAIFLYYKNIESVIFVHASFLFLMISMRELVKDLENIKGDLAQDYKTIPVVYGEKVSKGFLTFLIGLTIVPVYFLINYFHIGHMHWYYYLSVILLLVLLAMVLWSKTKLHYILLHTLLKLIIVLGVISIPLINIDLVTSRLF